MCVCVYQRSKFKEEEEKPQTHLWSNAPGLAPQ